MHRLPRWIASAACVAAVVSGPVMAQTARSGGNASAQLVQQMQQLASERTTLQAENDKLKSELADVKRDRDALKAGQQTLDRRAKDAAAALAHTRTQSESTDQELTQTKAKIQDLITKFRETIQKLRDTEAEGATAKQTLATRDHELSICTDHNLVLYHLDDEVLTRLEKQGVFTRVAQAEPFTKIKRIQLENYVDESRARARDQVLSPSAQPAAPSTSPPPPAAAGTNSH